MRIRSTAQPLTDRGVHAASPSEPKSASRLHSSSSSSSSSILPGCSRARTRTRTTAAFTLIEIVISSALMAMIVVAAFLCFSASVTSQKAMEPRLEVIQNARVAMALMAADLRSACPLDKDVDFLGVRRELGETLADSIDFATHNYTPRNANEGDFCETAFYLQPDSETGRFTLCRRRNPTIALDPFSGGKREEIATGVLGLGFEYYNGLDWYSSWGELRSGRAQNSQKERSNLTGMPEAVRITLWLDPNPHGKKPAKSETEAEREPPMVFQTVARLNLAGATPSGGSSAPTDAGGEVSPGAPTGGNN